MMKDRFATLLDHLLIGDALVSARSRYRVEYIQTSDVEACYVVLRGRDVVMLTPGDDDAHRADVAGLLARRRVHTEHFTRAPSGSICRLWDEDIGKLVAPNANWFVNGSPHTGQRRTQARRLVRCNERAQVRSGRVQAIWSRGQRGDRITDEVLFAVGGVCAIQWSRRGERLGYARVRSIRQQALGQINEAEVQAEGWARRDQFEVAWRSRNRLRAQALVWVIEVELIHQTVAPPPLVHLVAAAGEPARVSVMPIQLPMFDLVFDFKVAT